jgi:LacI family transcriptional regulator
MTVNQQTIAERLGVSISTVSLALRDAPQVAEETRHQVRALAEELGYKLRARRPYRGAHQPLPIEQITMLMRFAPTNTFYNAVLGGVEAACRNQHIALHYGMLDEVTPRTLAQYAESDGLLVTGAVPEAALLALGELDLPMVLIDNDLPHLGLNRVLIDNFGGMYQAVARLAQWGHRRIAVLPAPAGDPSFDARLSGYRFAVGRSGLPPLEVAIDGSPWPTSPGEGLPELRLWLQSDAARNVTALVAMNDESAIAVLHTIQDCGLRVPDDISVVGFDDIASAQIIRPALTTCHVPRERLGQLGVRLLIERAQTPDEPAQGVVLGTVFIERASTRRLR